MQGSKPRHLRFVVGSALLVGAPLAFGCSDGLTTSNPVFVEPTDNVSPELEPTTPTMEGVGVPLPSPNTVAHPMPDPNTVTQEAPTPNTVAPPEPPPEEQPRRFAPNPGPSEREAPTE